MPMDHTMSCEYPEGCSCGASDWNRLESERNFYRNRIQLLERMHHRFREPELTIIIDIMANGQLLPDPNGKRYGKHDNRFYMNESIPTPTNNIKQCTRDISNILNSISRENISNTPDFIMAEFMMDCLVAFEKASLAREKWYGKSLSING